MTYRSPIEILNQELAHQPPVDLEKLASQLGLSVRYKSDFPPNISGKIAPSATRESQSGYEILVNANDHRQKQRLTLAHEIAHYVLHRDLIGDGVTDTDDYRSELGEAREREAKNFAVEILLPAQVILSHVDKQDLDHAADTLGRAFEVSPLAMERRLADLGIKSG
ncbi:MAG TPA: ImmA/IrrE family metallo-endopeptidase [Stellaceae bacterium]|jgi:Zn-dependent peptidase ImmA (M78 family)